MVGDTVIDDNIEFVVIWNGSKTKDNLSGTKGELLGPYETRLISFTLHKQRAVKQYIPENLNIDGE